MSQTSHGDSIALENPSFITVSPGEAVHDPFFEQLEGEKTGTKTYVQPQLVHTSIRAVVRVFQ